MGKQLCMNYIQNQLKGFPSNSEQCILKPTFYLRGGDLSIYMYFEAYLLFKGGILD